MNFNKAVAFFAFLVAVIVAGFGKVEYATYLMTLAILNYLVGSK